MESKVKVATRAIGENEERLEFETERKRAKHEQRQHDLRHRVEFGDEQRLERHRLPHHPGQDDRRDDHDIARDHQDHEPARDVAWRCRARHRSRQSSPCRRADRDRRRARSPCRSAWPGSRRSDRSGPATRNRPKATRISPAVMAQTSTGTMRIRASVMRLGMLKSDAPARDARSPLRAAGKAHFVMP